MAKKTKSQSPAGDRPDATASERFSFLGYYRQCDLHSTEEYLTKRQAQEALNRLVKEAAKYGHIFVGRVVPSTEIALWPNQAI